MIARVAIAAPIEAAVNGRPLGAITAAPALRQRSASRMSPVTTTAARPGALGDPVVGRVERVGDDDPLDQRMRRHPQPGVADDPDRHLVPPRDLVDLVLDRAGVGVDQDDRRRRRWHGACS